MSNDVRRMMTTPLSDSDLKKILGDDIKIIIYSSLSNVSNLRDILTKDRDYTSKKGYPVIGLV